MDRFYAAALPLGVAPIPAEQEQPGAEDMRDKDFTSASRKPHHKP